MVPGTNFDAFLIYLKTNLLNCKTYYGGKDHYGYFELGVNDKFNDRDKYNTEIDSSND